MASMNSTPGYGTPPQHDQQSGSPPPADTSASSEYAPVQNGRKRKADGTSSRGVANLTPEQLAKKRANDREAQRAIRERTKNQIESLERRIKELESQQPFQELQNVVRARDAIQAENEDLKRRMQTLFALLQPIATTQGLNDLAAATAQQSPLPMAPPPAFMQAQPAQHDLPFVPHHLHPELRNAHSSPAQTAQQSLQHARADASPIATDRQQHDSRRWDTNPYPAPPPSAPTHDGNILHSSARSGLNHLLGNDQRAASTNASPQAREGRRRELVPIENGQPLSTRLPTWVDPTCPLDSLLLDFQAERRHAASLGTPSSTLVGPAYPSISSLLNPARSGKSHPLSKVFTDILGKFPSISAVPEQVAVLYIMFLVMRWHVAPTQENFDRLPPWVRPVRSQLEIAHPAWIDHLPWPMMRDRLTTNVARDPSACPFDSFFIPYTTTLSLNWPYEPNQCLLPAVNNKSHGTNGVNGNGALQSNPIESVLHGNMDDGEEFMINPVFESHLRNLDNWSLGSAFTKVFPDLVDDVRIKNAHQT